MGIRVSAGGPAARERSWGASGRSTARGAQRRVWSGMGPLFALLFVFGALALEGTPLPAGGKTLDNGTHSAEKGNGWRAEESGARDSPYSTHSVASILGRTLFAADRESRSAGGGGAAGLNVTDDHGNEPSTSTDFSTGIPVQGLIGTADDEDYFRLILGQPTLVSIYTIGDTDTLGTLIDGDGREVVANDDSGKSTNFRIEANLGQGIHYVRIRAVGGGTGGYELHADSRAFAPAQFRNSFGMDFALVPAGELESGAHSREWPVKAMAMSGTFYMGKRRVTTSQWKAVMGTRASEVNYSLGGYEPAAGVSWDDAQEFVERLNASERTTRYRLPTAAEWEYAARAGQRGGNYSPDFDSIAGFDSNGIGSRYLLDAKRENAFGLHDMQEHMWEWVEDAYAPNRVGTVTGPIGPIISENPFLAQPVGQNRSFRSGASRVRAWARSDGTKHQRSQQFDLGFRLVKSIEPETGSGVPNAVDQATGILEATPVAIGSSVSGQLEPGAGRDYFRLELSEPTVVEIYTTGSDDTVGALWNAGGAGWAATNDDSGEGGNFRIETILGPGTHILSVGSYGDEGATYTLHVEGRQVASQAVPIAIGSSVSGQLEPGAGPDYFRLELSEATAVAIYTTGSDDTLGALWIAGGTGWAATNDDSGEGSNFRFETILGPGTHILGVFSYHYRGATYTLHVEGRQVASQFAPVAIGGSVSGRVEHEGDVDYFRLELSEATVVAIYTTGSDDTLGALWIAGGTGWAATNDDSGEGSNFRFETILGPGTHILGVFSYHYRGATYTLHVEGRQVASQFAPVAIGGSVSGRVEHGGDVDYFRLELSEPTVVAIYTTGSDDTVGEVWNVGGAGRAATNDDSGEGGNFRIETILGPGTHIVSVGSDGGQEATYTLHVEGWRFATQSARALDDHGNEHWQASPLEIGTAVSGRIEHASDVDYFRVELSEPTLAAIYTTGSLDTLGSLRDSANAKLAGDDDGGEGLNFQIEAILDAGIHYVRVESYHDVEGSYTLHVERRTGNGAPGGLPPPSPGDDHGNEPSQATPLPIGTSVAGQIEQSDDVDYFRLELSEPTKVEIFTTGSLLGSLLTTSSLRDSTNGELVGEGPNFGIVTNLQAGIYYVRVTSLLGIPHAYRLHAGVDHGDEPSQAAPLAFGTAVDARIGGLGDVDYFRLDLSEPTEVEIFTTGDLDTTGSLRDSADGELAADDDEGEGSNFRIVANLQAGIFYVRVASFWGNTGTYRLQAERRTGSGPPGGGGTPGGSLSNSIGMEFEWVPAGEFDMGSTSDEADSDEQPVTRVRISTGFYMGKHEVTQGQWEAVMGTNPSYFKSCGADCPVDAVDWEEAQEFVRRLNEMEGSALYRLPTEAEWEYAARAGTTGERYSTDLDSIAWHGGNSGHRSHRVGEKQANEFGLHDMLGNMWEWVEDRYGDYPGGNVTDPTGPGEGGARVSRGGGWQDGPWDSRAAERWPLSPDYSYTPTVGFRLARDK